MLLEPSPCSPVYLRLLPLMFFLFILILIIDYKRRHAQRVFFFFRLAICCSFTFVYAAAFTSSPYAAYRPPCLPMLTFFSYYFFTMPILRRLFAARCLRALRERRERADAAMLLQKI